MNKFKYQNGWWRPTDAEIIPILEQYWLFHESGTNYFDCAFYEAVKCGRIVPATHPIEGELIFEWK